jgi:hypothetical protein
MSVADSYQIQIQMGKLIRIKEGHSGFQALHWMEGWRLLQVLLDSIFEAYDGIDSLFWSIEVEFCFQLQKSFHFWSRCKKPEAGFGSEFSKNGSRFRIN